MSQAYSLLCLELGRLATSRRGGCVTERPPRPRPRTPSPRVLAHGEQAGIPGPKLLCLELGRLATARRSYVNSSVKTVRSPRKKWIPACLPTATTRTPSPWIPAVSGTLSSCMRRAPPSRLTTLGLGSRPRRAACLQFQRTGKQNSRTARSYFWTGTGIQSRVTGSTRSRSPEAIT